MPDKAAKPQIDDLVRHEPSGLAVRVERIIPYHNRYIYQVRFSDGETEIVELPELVFDLQREEMEGFAVNFR